jgi:hypothetical protein
VKQQYSQARLGLILTALVMIFYGCARALPAETMKIDYAVSLVVLPARVSSAPVSAVDPSCLAGRWTVQNLREMMLESHEKTQGSLDLKRIEGEVAYSFDDQGTMTIAFDRLTVVLRGVLDGQVMQVEQVIDGAASARYSLDQYMGRVMLTSFSGEGITVGLDINGQRLVEGNFPVWRAFISDPAGEMGKPTSLVEYAQVQVECTGDSLTLQAFDPLPGPAIRLARWVDPALSLPMPPKMQDDLVSASPPMR